MHLSMTIDSKTISELTPKVIAALELVGKSGIGNHFSISISANTVYQFEATGTSILGTPAPKVEAEVITETKTEEKKAKAPKKEKPVLETVAETVVEEAKEALTKQDIQDACQKVSGSKGLDAAKKILASYKNAEGKDCKRISDIQESDYASFVADCEKA